MVHWIPLVGLVLLGVVAHPPAAAACGLLVPAEGNAQVEQERALISWDGQTEELVMEFTLQGAARDAAWIVPTPAPATARLAPPKLFDTLQALTLPRVVRQRRFVWHDPALTGSTEGGTAGAAPPPVSVLAQQTLGPFDVTTLAAQDATALVDWLAAHHYRVPPGLATALAPYVERHWSYTAVRLTPGVAPADVPQPAPSDRQRLSPLAVSFASDTIIYPLRMAGLAGRPLPVFLYVLADHRVAAPTTLTTGENPLQQGWLEVRSAQWLHPAALAADSALREFVARQRFLTKFEGYLEPSSMRDDWVLPLAASDETYQAVEVQMEYISVLGLLGRGVLVLGLVAFAAWCVVLVRSIRGV